MKSVKSPDSPNPGWSGAKSVRWVAIDWWSGLHARAPPAECSRSESGPVPERRTLTLPSGVFRSKRSGLCGGVGELGMTTSKNSGNVGAQGSQAVRTGFNPNYARGRVISGQGDMVAKAASGLFTEHALSRRSARAEFSSPLPRCLGSYGILEPI